MRGLLRRCLGLLFVLCLPLAAIGTNVRWVTLDPGTYRNGFERFRATERTGLSSEQLEAIAQAFIDYFRGPGGRLNPIVEIRGVQRPLFNEREVAHLIDVQRLMQLVFRAGLLATLYLSVYSLCLILAWRRAGLRTVGQLLLTGAAVTGCLLLGVAGLSMVDFDDLFTRFHELSFQNDLWMLDPSSDNLLILFPEQFWLEITLRLVFIAGLELVLAILLGLFLSRIRDAKG